MIPRFQHILIPVDFTEKNRKALDTAFEIAVVNHARITLLHVIEVLDVPADNELKVFYEKLDRHAQSELDKLSERFVAAGLSIDQKVRYGKRVNEIVIDANERKADLIIMNSHAIDLQKPMQGWATVSYQVSVLCACPILLVK